MWKFQIIQNWDEIFGEAHLTKWNALLSQSVSAHVFAHPALAKIWVDTYLPLRELTPLFVWGKSATNEVFVPLVLWKKNWKNAFVHDIIPVGYSDYDYQDPLFLHPVNAGELESFWKELTELMKSLGSDSVTLSGIRNAFLGKSLDWQQGEPCPYLDLQSIHTDEELMRFFSTSLRGDIRRQIRRLGELGKLSFQEYHSWEEAQSTFSNFMDTHAKKWPHAYKAPLFHENLLKQGLGTVVHFSSLNVDDKPIAWHLGFEFNGCYYYYMPAGLLDYAKYSPVKVHLYYLMRRAVENCFVKFDHLRGEENYKQGWSNGVDFVNGWHWDADSLTAKAKQTVLALRSKLGK